MLDLYTFSGYRVLRIVSALDRAFFGTKGCVFREAIIGALVRHSKSPLFVASQKAVADMNHPLVL